MKNQIIGVKFLHSQSYQELLQAPSLLSLTAGKTYAYISAGFDITVGDIVIVPNSGYNDTPLVPAIVTVLDYQKGLEFATKPILAVIPYDKMIQHEQHSLDIYQELQRRQNLMDQLETVYDDAIKMKKFRKLAKKNPDMAVLLDKLDHQDELINNLPLTDTHKPTEPITIIDYDDDDNNEKENIEDDPDD